MVKQYQCRSCGVAIPTSSVSHLCSPCLQEHYYVQRKCAPAKRLGLPADLTPSQWKNTLSHFNGLCAYCQKTKWDVFEHFIPTALGGGATVYNCVPACLSCNRRKYNFHPALVTSIPSEDIERVRVFLQQRLSEAFGS